MGALHGALNAVRVDPLPHLVRRTLASPAHARRRHGARRRGADRRLGLPRRPPHHRPQGRQPQPGLRRRRGGPADADPAPAAEPPRPGRRSGRPHVIDRRRAGRAGPRRPRRGPPWRARPSCCCTASRRTRAAGPRCRRTLHRAGTAHPRPGPARLLARGRPPTSRPTGSARWRPTSLAVLDAAGARAAHVVGHDWGGAVAWYLGAHHADRVDALTVLSTPHPGALAHVDDPVAAAAAQLVHPGACRCPCCPSWCCRAPWAPALRLSGLPAGDRADQYARAVRRRRRPAGPAGLVPRRRAPAAVGGARRPSVARWRVRRDVTVPTTYVWGRHDPVLGRAAAEATARPRQRGDYLFVELDAGHWLPELHPEEVAGAVLDRVRFSGLSRAWP